MRSVDIVPPCLREHCPDMGATLLCGAHFLPMAFAIGRAPIVVPLTMAGRTTDASFVQRRLLVRRADRATAREAQFMSALG